MILAIETSGIFPSVGIIDLQGREFYYKQLQVKQTHAEQLGAMVNDALQYVHSKDSGMKLSAVAINEGPGSYTGLRIGSSLAKGLCFSMNLPLIAVRGMTGMGQNILQVNSELQGVWVMLDARRDEVYASLIPRQSQRNLSVKAMILPGDFAGNSKDAHLGFAGDCITKVAKLLSLEADTAMYEVLPSARDLYSLSLADFISGNFRDVAYFEPFYLKEFEVGISKKFTVG